MEWHVESTTHRIEVYVRLDTPRRVAYTTGTLVEVEAVQFVFEDGIPTYSPAGMQVYGRKVMFNDRLREGKPVAYYLHFTEHPWLDNIRREIEDSYRIERRVDVATCDDPVAEAA